MPDPVQLIFHSPGLQTLIQDQGRKGPQAFGIPIGGAMDKGSACFANRLVGNPETGPVLEITLMGPKIEFIGDCWIALCGADLSPLLDASPVNMYEPIFVQSSSLLSFGRPRTGCRTYLAVAGSWTNETWMGSYSAFAQAGMEIPLGSVIRKGSAILIHPSNHIPTRTETVSPVQFPESITVKTFPGPEFSQFDSFTIGHFFSRAHTLSNQSNRMGYRLTTKLARFQPEQELISSGVIPGTIQITHAGQAIVLMADAQTTGGYFRIGIVHSEEMDKMGQLKPGDRVRFELMDVPF